MARAAATALCSLLLVVMACRHAQAGSPTDALRDVLLEVNRLLDDPELRQRPPELRAAMRRVLLPSFDARETARLALGAEWLGRTPGERDEFAALLADHLERAVVLRVAAHAPMHRALAIRSMAESIEGGTATVVVAMTNRAGGEFPVEYRLIREGDRWAIYDVVIDGGSLVANYRTMFARVLRESSYADLVALLRTRTSDGPAASTRAAASGEVSPAPSATSAAPGLAPRRDRTADARPARPLDPRARGSAPPPSAGPPTSEPVRPPSASPPGPVAAPPPSVKPPLIQEPAPSPSARPSTAAPAPALSASQASAEPTLSPSGGEPAAAARGEGDGGGAGPRSSPAPSAGEKSPALLPRSVESLTPARGARATADSGAASRPPSGGPKTTAHASVTTYWLQVGAFKDQGAAAGLAARLRASNLPVSVDAATLASGERETVVYRVRVGPFADRAEASARLKDLQGSGLRPFLAAEGK